MDNRGCFFYPSSPVFLITFGHPVLHDADGFPVGGLRRKDLALLIFLCLEGPGVHSRPRLASLLWGDSPEERARHSLTQALGRLGKALPPGVMSTDKESVRWAGGLPCDANVLLGAARGEPWSEAPWLYSTHFLEGFDAGRGARDFADWADRRRAELRNAAIRLLEAEGDAAEAAGAWERALRLGERAVEIDPFWEGGHRRIVRALAAGGERNRALRHYQAFEAWLAEEVGARPDPDTLALATRLRSPTPAAEPAQAAAGPPPAEARAEAPPVLEPPAAEPPAAPAADEPEPVGGEDPATEEAVPVASRAVPWIAILAAGAAAAAALALAALLGS